MRSSNARAFNIRQATTDDVDRLCEFAQELLAKMQSKATEKDARAVFHRMITHSDAGVLLVAEHKSGICAYSYASFQWRSEFGGEIMDLVELFVEQSGHCWSRHESAESTTSALRCTRETQRSSVYWSLPVSIRSTGRFGRCMCDPS
jgi:hypothetical protein